MKTRLILGAAALSLAPLGASAHATLDVAEAASGAYQRIAVRIPHGCDGAPTNTVEVEIPEGVIATKPMPKPGWTLETVKGAYAHSYDNHGKTVTEGVRLVRWSGGALPNDFYDEFVLRGKVAAEGGAALPFKVRQLCPDGGEVYWSEIAAAGQDPHALKRPAPVLRVAQAAGGMDHAAMGHAGMATLGPIAIHDAFAFANPSGGGASAAFMRIETTGADDKLVSAASDVAEKVELHTHDKDDQGVMRMHEVPFIPLSADEPAMLQPGGYHVMFMGLNAPMEPGGEVQVTLTFEKAGDVSITIPVIARNPGAGGHKGHDMKHGEHKHGG